MSSGSAQQLEKNLGTAATVDGKRMMFTAACAAAIREEMERDERVFIMGEDIEEAMLGRTSGLLERFGPSRVRNTPISEAAFVGAGTGAAATGMIPIVDLFMSNFLYVAADQLLNNANKLRYMMGGQVTLPMTILASTGAPGAIGAQHSDAPYAQVINGGGVKVVIPTNPADLKGLLKSAIRDPNPVLVLLPMALGSVSGEVPQEEYLIPLGKGSVAAGRHRRHDRRDRGDGPARGRRRQGARRRGHLRRSDRPAHVASARRRAARLVGRQDRPPGRRRRGAPQLLDGVGDRRPDQLDRV